MGRDVGQETRLLESAQTKAEAYERSVDDVPFWRFKLRRKLAGRARRARSTEARLRQMVE
jgi:hypothetical protein